MSLSEGPRLITITDWDAKLPTAEWSGPSPLPLFPPAFGHSAHVDELLSSFRDSHIIASVPEHVVEKIRDWVEVNVPEDKRWLVQIFENQPDLPVKFFALNSVHMAETDSKDFEAFRDKHPEVFTATWNHSLDQIRAEFAKRLEELGCMVSLVSNEEAIDGGTLTLEGYERPRAFVAGDLQPGTGDPTTLWRYSNLTKFARLLQTKELWFSRPYKFDDPHEFSTDRTTQQSLVEWRLNSFCRAYNSAVRASRTTYLQAVASLVVGLTRDGDDQIQRQSKRFSELSPILLSSIGNDLREWQNSYCISCWRFSEHDSIAMWRQYASLEEGIAIVANRAKLRASLRKSGDIRFAIVNYVDLSSEGAAEPMSDLPLGYKDVRYASEEEARFYFQMPRMLERPGFGMRIELSEVVEKIYLSPNATQGFRSVVVALLAKYGLDKEVVESPLRRVPSKF